ncbi:tripartite tricarboxylate transporter permease, partial [Candidatus Micrarchaeota archaeon]|nr:tripartite tricarboxylate transporter permease [Candidatus Micrarchaeota archaeon]
MLDFLAGIAFGFAIGLLPGFHINNALPALVALVPFAGTTFIVSASVSFVFSSLVPATVLRLPNEETALIASESLHADALHACVLASVLACFFSLVVLAFYSAFLPQLYPAAGSVMPLLLLVIVGMLALQGLGNALVVGVSSMLGMITFNGDYLLPLLSGFFGTSALLRARDGTTPRPATARSIA